MPFIAVYLDAVATREAVLVVRHERESRLRWGKKTHRDFATLLRVVISTKKPSQQSRGRLNK